MGKASKSKKSKKVPNYKQISTGHGNHIIQHIVEMYNKLNKTNVSYEIIDLKDEDGGGVGTRVVIKV